MVNFCYFHCFLYLFFRLYGFFHYCDFTISASVNPPFLLHRRPLSFSGFSASTAATASTALAISVASATSSASVILPALPLSLFWLFRLLWLLWLLRLLRLLRWCLLHWRLLQFRHFLSPPILGTVMSSKRRLSTYID